MIRALNVSDPTRAAVPLLCAFNLSLSLFIPPPPLYPLPLSPPSQYVQPGEYRSILHAFYRIITEEGAHELYRGLGPSLIGIVPYAGSNYFAYDTLRTLYKRLAKKDKIEPLATLIIGSLAGAAAASATFPLEVARKQFAGSNFLAYDTLCTLAGAGLRRCACWAAVCFFLSLGAASGFAGAASAASFATAPASPTFPLKEALPVSTSFNPSIMLTPLPFPFLHFQMQVGALKGRVVYKGTLDCIQRIVQEQGIQGLYRGLVPSCVKLMPAAGISFMCYEALKHVFVEDDKASVAKPGGV
ncbi:unnamed protein product [Closterium sp. NIES-54]